MTHGSLFSGIGGFDLAAHWMGWDNTFHCEWNPFGQKILKHHFPNSISYNDITKTDFTIHEGAIDVLSGGFPCQPYSSAGKRLGKEDERHLWPEMLRTIKEIKPTWIVGENVLGIVNWGGDWYSMRCKLTWKIKATKYKRIYFQLAAKTHLTKDKEFSLWPTPTARDTQGPQAQELKKLRGEPTIMNIESVPGRIRSITGIIGQNNPMFYYEMMGYPPDWTLKPFLVLEENQLKQQETL